MANAEENPVEEVTEVVEEKKTPEELIAKHEAEIDKINEQMTKLGEEGKKLAEGIEKVKKSMLELGTIRAQRAGAIAGLKELMDG